jgi:hypothetical protein
LNRGSQFNRLSQGMPSSFDYDDGEIEGHENNPAFRRLGPLEYEINERSGDSTSFSNNPFVWASRMRRKGD